MKSETFSLKTVISKYDFLGKTVFYSMKRLKKRSIIVCNLINRKKYLILVMLKNTIIYKKKNTKVSKTIKNNYSATKSFWKSKIADIKSVILKNPEFLHELSKTIQGRIQRFWKVGALCVGHHGWLAKKFLDFSWSKKAEIT